MRNFWGSILNGLHRDRGINLFLFFFWSTQINKTLLLIRKDFSLHIQGWRRNWKSGGCTYNYTCTNSFEITTYTSLPIKIWGALHPIMYNPIPYSKQAPPPLAPKFLHPCRLESSCGPWTNAVLYILSRFAKQSSHLQEIV